MLNEIENIRSLIGKTASGIIAILWLILSWLFLE